MQINLIFGNKEEMDFVLVQITIQTETLSVDQYL